MVKNGLNGGSGKGWNVRKRINHFMYSISSVFYGTQKPDPELYPHSNSPLRYPNYD